MQLLDVSLHVLNRARSHAAVLRSLGHGRRNLHHQARVKRFGDQVLGAKRQAFASISRSHHLTLLGLGQFGNRVNRRNLHLVSDGGGASVQRATEDIGETEDVVDLVVIVAAACGDDGVVAHGFDFFGRDLWVGIGQGHDDGLGGHALDHLWFQHATGGETQKYIGAIDDVSQGARICLLGELDLVLIHQFGAALIDHARQVGDKNIFAGHTHLEQQTQTRQRSSACP